VSGPLTDDEQAAVQLAGDLWVKLRAIVYADGYDAEIAAEDLRELTTAVHVIQRHVMSQAAARTYPGAFRLLGRPLEPS
jgi:hypothetical protein